MGLISSWHRHAPSTQQAHPPSATRHRSASPRPPPLHDPSLLLALRGRAAAPRLSRPRWARHDAGRLLSVNVGGPREIEWQGKTVRTAIWKEPVDRAADGAAHQHRRRRPGRPARPWRRAPRGLRLPDRVLPLLGARARARRLRPTASSARTSPSKAWPTTRSASVTATAIGAALFEVTQPRVTCYRVGHPDGRSGDAVAARRPPPPGLLPARARGGARCRPATRS